MKARVLVASIIALGITSTTSFAQSSYTPYTFTTLAGLAGIGGSTDGAGSAARFHFPYGIAVDSAGNLYVADNATLRKVTIAGVVTTLVAGFRAFTSPRGVAVDSADNIYIADVYYQSIKKMTPEGVVTTLAGDASITNYLGYVLGGSEDGTGTGARFQFPQAVAVDSAGNVYVADMGNNTIRKVTPAGVVTTLAGLAGNRGSADGTGNAARFRDPSGVAVDGAGNVYVADTGNSAIRKVSPAGVVTTLAGNPSITNILGVVLGGSADGTGGAARFNAPTAVAVDGAGNVYVTDNANATIRKITSVGVVTTVAGLAGAVGSADGTSSVARFSGTWGVAVDSVGNLYVTDSGNHIIRQGFPAQFAAPIMISGSGLSLYDRSFGFTVTGPMRQLVVVEASTDLSAWLPVWTNTLAGVLEFRDPQSSLYSNRCYRVRAQ